MNVHVETLHICAAYTPLGIHVKLENTTDTKREKASEGESVLTALWWWTAVTQ